MTDIDIDYKSLFAEALEKNTDNKKWAEGDYIGIKTISNTKVGSVGQDFIESLCKAHSIPIDFPLRTNGTRATQSSWDVDINGVKFELKTATEDVSGCFQFNHIRYHREYEAVLCLGVTPEHLYFGAWTKADVATGRAGRLVSMEKGANASYKLTKKASGLRPITEFDRYMREFTETYKLSV